MKIGPVSITSRPLTQDLQLLGLAMVLPGFVVPPFLAFGLLTTVWEAPAPAWTLMLAAVVGMAPHGVLYLFAFHKVEVRKMKKWSEGLKAAAACVTGGLAWLVGGVMGLAWWHVVIAVCAVAVLTYSVLSHVRLTGARRTIKRQRRKLRKMQEAMA